MSILSDFVSGVAPQAHAIIGTKLFLIGSGVGVEVVPAEERHDRAHELNGFAKNASLTLSIETSKFVEHYPDDVQSYNGKYCTFDGSPWKIGDISKGQFYVDIALVDRTEVA